MQTEHWALMFSIISLMASAYSGLISIRSSQFAQICELQTRLAKVKMGVEIGIFQLNKAHQKLLHAQITDSFRESSEKMRESMNSTLETQKEVEDKLEDWYQRLRKNRLYFFSFGTLEKLQHYVDTQLNRLTIFNEKLIPEFDLEVDKLVEEKYKQDAINFAGTIKGSY